MLKSFAKKTKIGLITIVEDDDKIVQLILPTSNSIVSANICETTLLKNAFFELEEYLNGKRKNFDLPLNPKGTDFQQTVWKQLLKIPYGKTVTYSEIATQIKKPNAQRAVGSANNKNPIPIFIPCHRVIGKNDYLTGYAGGIDLKEKLLNTEKSHNY